MHKCFDEFEMLPDRPMTPQLAALEDKKIDVSAFSRLLFIQSFFFNWQVTRTCIKFWMSSNFGQMRPLTAGLAALECLKYTP